MIKAYGSFCPVLGPASSYHLPFTTAFINCDYNIQGTYTYIVVPSVLLRICLHRNTPYKLDPRHQFFHWTKKISTIATSYQTRSIAFFGIGPILELACPAHLDTGLARLFSLITLALEAAPDIPVYHVASQKLGTLAVERSNLPPSSQTGPSPHLSARLPAYPSGI